MALLWGGPAPIADSPAVGQASSPLNEAASAMLSSAGAATVTIGPVLPQTSWHITTAAVVSTSSNQIPTCRLYLGVETPANFLGGTYNGANDSTDLDVLLWPSQVLRAVWAGGIGGTSVTLSIFGEIVRR